MKRIKLNYLSSTVIAALILSSCASLTKMRDNASTVSYQVKPNPLETHAGEVKVTIDTKFPEKFFNKNAVVVATPVLKYEGGETEFEPTTLQGEKVEANNKVIPYAGGSYTYSGSITYKPEMMKSQLVVKMSAKLKKGEPVEFESQPIADGVIATPLLVEVDPKTLTLGDKYQRIIPQSYKADIHYVIDRSDIRKSELKSDSIIAFQNALKTVQADSNLQLKGAKISAYASPDGPIPLNEKLSVDRESSAQKYLDKAFKDNKITEAEAATFLSKMNTAEDWDGFKNLMEKSNIQDKDLILRVLSMYSDPNVRETEIKKISNAYKEIAEEVLPQLRRSVLILNVDSVGRSDAELLNLALSNPKALGVEEILHAASLTSDLDKQAAIYKAATEQFPSCFRAKNNLGHVYMLQGKVADAKAEFDAAKALQDNAVIKANEGAAALAQGDLKSAEELLTSAMSAGDAVSYNLGIIKIKEGDYAAAVNYFGNTPSFDAALAQLLNGSNDKAIATLNALGDVKDPWVYYLKAVANARGGNNDGVYNNLRTAIGLDASVKTYAQKDAEFLKLANDDTFKQIIQ